jgi:uncharacterized cupredoxin-like copper-binding protein/predicted O-methyltransferase YrrM
MLLVGIALAAQAGAQTPHSHEHSFGDADKWAKVFDDPRRDAWQKPHQVIQALALKPDAVIADIGSGTGYFSMRFAHMVPKGRVYGLDTEPDMVKYLAGRAKREGLRNVSAVLARPDEPKLPEKADLVVLVDVFHHIEQRERYFAKLRASLKPGGRVAVIDFRMDSPEGPPKAARIAPEQVTAELSKAGYVLDKAHDFLPNQYFLVFRPAGTAHAHDAKNAFKAHVDYARAEQTDFGVAADARKAKRTVRIEMSDRMRFNPATVTVKQGEIVRLVPANRGKQMHEMVLGKLADLKAHAELMKKHPAMEHDEPHMAHVAPGKRGEIGWRFNRAGTFYFACLVPGHFESGMIGKVEVIE